MAFVDEVTITAHAGKGGNGVIRWLRQKETAKGGPVGGDGGRGGDVVLEGVRDLAALATYRFDKRFRAENGEAGGPNNKHGADGEPATLKVPVGTVATLENGETFELLAEGDRIVAFKGGIGGFGNAHYKGSTNQNPFQQTDGRVGEGGDIHLTLKIIAEAGFIGFPNAGKSSLLNALTRARSKVASYEFTTLDPHLGDFYGHLLADIPGLIEGASDGRGLGSKFLRHVERTGFLVHLVSSEQEDVVAAYRAIRKELEAFGHGLPEKKELVVLSKVDVLTPEEQKEKLEALTKEAGKEVVPLSVIDDVLMKSFSDRLAQSLAAK
ncbi:MAG: Obg family GTPase CgtA [Parcubacteria bacterium C7867-001]|nr:MAG: Obg family GTPase CgtA [Parcubacteria bacterium C7867-001]